MHSTIHCNLIFKKSKSNLFRRDSMVFFFLYNEVAPDSDEGASSAFSKGMNGEFSTTIDINQAFGTLSRRFIGTLNMHIG